MPSRILIAALFILIGQGLHSQESYLVDWDFKGHSFKGFVEKVEMRYPVRFFYENVWVEDIVLGDYPGKKMLGEILDTLCASHGLHYYLPGFGNIILTKEFEVRVLRDKISEAGNYIPGIDYSGGDKAKGAEGNIVMNIGNPFEKGQPGKVELSGYITNRDTKEPVAGVTVYFPGLASGTFTNEHGYYIINVPRGSHNVRFTFIVMKELVIDMNVYGSGELNLEIHP